MIIMVLADKTQAIISALIVIPILIIYLWRFAPSRRWLAIAWILCLIDQGAKAFTQRYFWLSANEGHFFHHTFLGGWLNIDYYQNRELGFGNSSAYLPMATILLAGALAFLYRRLRRREYHMSMLTESGCALLLSGLFSIMLDRIRLGYVVDFIGIGRRDYSPCNIADLAAFAGAILLVLAAAQAAILRYLRPRPRPVATTSRPAEKLWFRRLLTPVIQLFAVGILLILWNVVAVQDAQLPALHKAAYRGRESSVSRLLAAGVDPNSRDGNDFTPLYYAAMGGHTEVAKRLIASGAKVNSQEGKYHDSPLDRAISGGGGKEFVDLLLSYGADLTPNSLYYAVTSRDAPLVKTLLAHGAEVNPNDRATPLLGTACISDNAEVVKLLIGAGAKVNAQDKDGKTALHRAATQGDSELVAILLSASADVNAKDNSGRTPLIVCGDSEVASLLIAHGGKVNVRSNDGFTPLIRAVLRQDPAWVNVLIKAGADVNCPGPNGWSPLHYAAAKGSKAVANALMSAGAEVGARNEAGKTPMDLASNAEMKTLLSRQERK